jgi:branched-chain amino acid transport system permease protein
MFVILAISWNIIGGYARYLSLGQTVFLGINAYVSSMLFVYMGLSPWIGMFVGILINLGIAAVIGFLTFKLRDAFFALTSIAIIQVFRLLALYFKDYTGGARGIILQPRYDPLNFLFIDILPYYYIALGLLVFSVLVAYLLDKGKLGYYLRAIGDDELACESVGINTLKYKIYAFMLSALIAAPVGTLYAQYILYVTPDGVFSFPHSIKVAVMSIIGGSGTLLGPIIGAAILIPLEQILTVYFSGVYGLNLVIYGVLLIVVMRVIPRGILEPLEKLFREVGG